MNNLFFRGIVKLLNLVIDNIRREAGCSFYYDCLNVNHSHSHI